MSAARAESAFHIIAKNKVNRIIELYVGWARGGADRRPWVQFGETDFWKGSRDHEAELSYNDCGYRIFDDDDSSLRKGSMVCSRELPHRLPIWHKLERVGSGRFMERLQDSVI